MLNYKSRRSEYLTFINSLLSVLNEGGQKKLVQSIKLIVGKRETRKLITVEEEEKGRYTHVLIVGSTYVRTGSRRIASAWTR